MPIGGVPTDPFQSRVGYYLENIQGVVHYQNQAIDGIYLHFHIERQPSMPTRAPYIPTWEEIWTSHNFGAGLSGAIVDENDE